jgi:hypothetical protein
MIHPNALYIRKTLGLNKQHILSVLTNCWELDSEDIIEFGLTNYVLHTYPASYIRAMIKDGLLTLDGRDYSVIYRSCGPATLKNYKEGRISYRAHPLGNFAIIQPVL